MTDGGDGGSHDSNTRVAPSSASPRSASGPDGSWWLASASGPASRRGISRRFVSASPDCSCCRTCCGRARFERLGGLGLAALVLGGGAPVLLANYGLLFAPAAHAGALFPGVMPLMVAILAAAVLQEALPRKKIGFALILPGVFGIAWGAGGAVGARQNIGSRAVSRLRPGMGLLHGRDASRASRWPSRRRHRRGRCLASLLTRLSARDGNEPRQGPVGRHRSSGARAGAPDRGRFTRLLRPRGQHPRRLERGRVRRSMPGDDRGHGYTDPRRVAERHGLDGHRLDLGRSIRPERRTAAGTTGLRCVASAFPSTHGLAIG